MNNDSTLLQVCRYIWSLDSVGLLSTAGYLHVKFKIHHVKTTLLYVWAGKHNSIEIPLQLANKTNKKKL